MNLFISYSHKDDLYRKRLDVQLSMLKRQRNISSWTDRKIIPGQEWDSEIDESLEHSDIVLLLVSPDFLGSEYCYDKEMVRALQKHESGHSVVVPIILRPCDWKSASFSKLQALPTEARAVSTWSDEDEAWLDVVNELKKTIKYAKARLVKALAKETILGESVAQEFSDWLNDTEIELKHRRVDKVSLYDIFVWPDLKVLNDDMDHITRSINAREILEEGSWSLVFGDEQSGKTTLSKYYF
jgi:hypothetical protein